MTDSNVHPADSYGELKAKLAELTDAAAAVRDQIIAMGLGAHEGDLFRATVSVAPRKSIDWQAVAYTLRPSFEYPADRWSPDMAAMVAANTTVKPVTTVTVKARKGTAA